MLRWKLVTGSYHCSRHQVNHSTTHKYDLGYQLYFHLLFHNWLFLSFRNFNLSVEREHELEEVLTFSHLLCGMTRSYLKCLVCRFSTTFMVFMNPTTAICLVRRFSSKIHTFLGNMHSLLLGNTVHFVTFTIFFHCPTSFHCQIVIPYKNKLSQCHDNEKTFLFTTRPRSTPTSCTQHQQTDWVSFSTLSLR